MHCKKTTFKDLFVFFGAFPLNITMCPVADTALAATSNCPAPKYFVRTSDSATLSAQSRFHVGTKKKKKRGGGNKKKNKTVTLTFALSHSPTSQMQRPMSSEGAASSLSVTAKDVAVSVDEMVAEMK